MDNDKTVGFLKGLDMFIGPTSNYITVTSQIIENMPSPSILLSRSQTNIKNTFMTNIAKLSQLIGKLKNVI